MNERHSVLLIRYKLSGLLYFNSKQWSAKAFDRHWLQIPAYALYLDPALVVDWLPLL